MYAKRCAADYAEAISVTNNKSFRGFDRDVSYMSKLFLQSGVSSPSDPCRQGCKPIRLMSFSYLCKRTNNSFVIYIFAILIIEMEE